MKCDDILNLYQENLDIFSKKFNHKPIISIVKIYLDLNIRYVKFDVNPLGEIIKLGGMRAGIGFEFRF